MGEIAQSNVESEAHTPERIYKIVGSFVWKVSLQLKLLKICSIYNKVNIHSRVVHNR